MIIEKKQVSGIVLFWNGLVKEQYTQIQYKEFMDSYYKLCLKYPKVVLKQRIDEFLQTSAMKKNYSNVLRDSSSVFDNIDSETVYKQFVESGKWQKPINEQVRKCVIRILEGRKLSDYNQTNWVYTVFWNLIPPILLIMVAVICLLIEKKIVYALILTLSLIKTALVFVTAPSPFFMYYFSEYMIGYVVLVILIIYNIKKLKQERKK